MSSSPLRLGFALLLCLAFNRLTAAPLPRSTPEAQGISSAAILAFVNDAENNIDALHSLMIVRHGQVVAEGWWTPYGAESPHQLFSLSKSFTSTAIGLLAAEGKLNINDLVLPYFPEYAPATPSDNLKVMRIRDLLSMVTGNETEAPIWGATEPWAKVFLAQPVPYAPGTHFLYNTAATYMLSAIAQKVTGQTLLDYLHSRLFAPLGIDQPTWETNAEGICLGGSGLHLRTEDIAKFGLLCLQKGRWNGRQLVPEEWLAQATARQTSTGSDPDNDKHQGYGFQFWRLRHHAYRASGAHGQFCVVLPEQDIVIAITGGTTANQLVMDLIWRHFLPGLQPTALPADPAAQTQLTARLARLTLPVPAATTAPTVATAIAGHTYEFPANDSALNALRLDPAADGTMTVHLKFNGKDQSFTCQPGTWQKTRLVYKAEDELPYAVAGAWTATDTYTLKLCAYETPYLNTVRLKFSGDTVACKLEPNVDWGPIKIITLTGQRAK